MYELQPVTPFKWRIPKSSRADMRVDGIIYADRELLDVAGEEQAIEQVVNVACLPGIVKASFAMPDIHWGYGFPIGGVAATHAENGVISPGGVGYDISCGVRLLRTSLDFDQIKDRLPEIASALGRDIPKGVGSRGSIRVNRKELERILERGVGWAGDQGYAWPADSDVIEEGGTMAGARPDLVSERAYERGLDQPGTLGAGNHFLEVQEVTDIYDPVTASVFGLRQGQIVVMIHSGSRGLGHQICTDYLKVMERVAGDYGIRVPDRQLACVPIESRPGLEYIGAMNAAINYALNNRQCLTFLTRRAFEGVFKESAVGLGMTLLYDVSHNTAKFERHMLNGQVKRFCVHRKGATRAFPPGHPDLPLAYRDTGQPVIIPGDMGRASYVLAGTETGAGEAFASTCHGAGRVMSRKSAKKVRGGRQVQAELAAQGITVIAGNIGLLSEEAPYAYKDVSKVVEVCERAGLSRKVARVRPVIVIKG